jgi:DRTGG domain.
MNVKELSEKLQLEIISGMESLNREVTGIYCCDLLSLVMGRAPADSIWLTVMGNMNSVAVATLADISCIVLCEGCNMDAQGLEKAREKDVAILCTTAPIYETAMRLSKFVS